VDEQSSPELQDFSSGPASLVWFRRDLRLHDHHPLHQALGGASPVLAVYCFDPAEFGMNRFGVPKTGFHRTKFILESVEDLRQSFRRLGGELVIRIGSPDEVLAGLAERFSVQTVFAHRLIGVEENETENRVRRRIEGLGGDVRFIDGHTLIHPDDLPFAVDRLPAVFTGFRKAVESDWKVRPAIESPSSLTSAAIPEGFDPGRLPTAADLGGNDSPPEFVSESRDLTTMSFTGGETAGKLRWQEYAWDEDRLRVYKETRNGMLSPLDSSRLSAWLSLGCLSPRWVADEIRRYETQRVANDSTYWLIFELLWRDYFSFIAMRHRADLFRRGGIRHVDLPWSTDASSLQAWREGRTGFPLVDANMREIATTGYMSNRGRQNVGSFLTKNLNIDWRLGAQWFESLLVDYDPASNYGNWNYVAGVGNDARGFRFFNITKQARDYDGDGSYVRHWLPELRQVPKEKIHEPWTLSAQEQAEFGVAIGVDYPAPIVDLFRSAKRNRASYGQATRV